MRELTGRLDVAGHGRLAEARRLPDDAVPAAGDGTLAADAEDAMPAGADTRATGGPENGATE